MLRKGLVDQLALHGDDRRAIVVDLGGTYVDVGGVRFDAEGNVVVLVLDQNDLQGALSELMHRRGRPVSVHNSGRVRP